MIFSSRYHKCKIGILYICTGKYSVFWKRFYESSEQYFCPKIRKQYFVFTDQEIEHTGPNVTVIYQQKLGWPYDTLMRFHMFNRIKDQLSETDFLFFFNANMVFLRKVKPSQMLPNKKEKLVGTRHPFFYESISGGPFETNPDSTAYTDLSKVKHYLAGGLSGGYTADYLLMSERLAANIDKDKEKEIIAKWHDESHLNSYFSKLSHYKVLDPGYIVPEFRLANFPFKPYITVLDKHAFGDLEYLRK